MFRQLLLAGLVGGAIVFVMSAIQNGVFPAAEPRSLPSQAAILPVLRASVPQEGFYFFPGGALSRDMTREQREAAQADHERRFKDGPSGILVYTPGGKEFAFGRRLMIQFLLSVLAALAAAAILAVVASTTTYGARVGIVFLLGCFAFVYLEPQYWNWYGFPASYTIARICGGVGTWTVAGLVMAAIIH
jgi:hypothetical protein